MKESFSKGRVLSLALCLLVVAGGLLLWPNGGPPSGGDRAPAGEPPADATPSPRVVAVENEPEAGERAVVPAEGPAPLEADETILRGRCVDRNGAPLAGVRATLLGMAARGYRPGQAAVVVDPDPPPGDPEVITGDDGTFAFRGRPRPRAAVFLFLRHPERVRLENTWQGLPAGEVVDLGDVVVPSAVVVRGRVLDTADAPVAGAEVRLRLVDPGDEPAFRPDLPSGRDAGADGRYEFTGVPSRPLRLSVEHREVVEPEGVVTPLGPIHQQRIVVRTLADAAVPAIRGIVVDEQGEPLRATVRIVEDSVPPWVRTARTGEGGYFTLSLPQSAPSHAPVSLAVKRSGYAAWRSDTPVAWGTDGLRITLRRGPPLQLRVTRADDGRAVERYGVALSSAAAGAGNGTGQRTRSSVADRPLGLWERAAVTPGRYEVVVTPDDASDLAASSPRPLEVVMGQRCEVHVRLQAASAQPAGAEEVPEVRVEVVDAGGAPVAGARVELWALEEGRRLQAVLARIERLERVFPGLEDSGRTDAAGRVTLRGVPERHLALRLPGPGHVPRIVESVRATRGEPLRIVVQPGALLRGRITPLEVLEQIRDEGRNRLGANMVEPPGVALRRPEGEPRFVPPVPIDADGAFEIRDIPPGSWTVQLRWRQAVEKGSGGVTSNGVHRGVHGPVQLGAGEERELEVDIAPLRRHAVTVRCHSDGEAGSVRLDLRGRLRLPSGRSGPPASRFAFAGADGRAEVDLPAGDWQVTGTVRVEGHPVYFAGPRFRVPDACEPGVDVHLRLGRRRVRLDLPDGSPAVGVMLRVPPEDVGRAGANGNPTDARGRTTLRGRVGVVRLRARRAPLRDRQRLQEWLSAHPEADESATFVRLGELELLPGADDEVVLQLPAEWQELPK